MSAQGTSKTAAPKAFSPRITTIFHKLGDGFVRIRSYQYGDAKEPYFIALHDDELTAITSTQKLLAKTGGILVRIDNNKQRNIKFKLGGKPYTFDPNRIFSDTGINQTLAMFGKITSTARDEVDKFAHRVLKLLPASPVFIISLHNNTNGRFSITSYLKGEDREKDAKTIRLVPNEDPDDLFLTTDSMFFEKLVKGNFNTILQDNANARKDGSLSIYCGEKNIPYLNCETEHGRLKQYDNMIGFAVKYLRTEKVKTQLPAFTYNYKLLPEPVTISLSKGDGIYFGEKKVGSISAATDKNSGRIEMLESFPLYDNMDFYIFSSGNGGHRIELRIDPTRSKKLVNREKDTIQMKVSN
ncbi:MAG: hypothetical protein WDN26_03745 [Chitinophagaceae bacterium]